MSNYAFAPDSRKGNSVIVTSGNRQRSQSTARATEITRAKRYLKPRLRDVFGFARVFHAFVSEVPELRSLPPTLST